ncbi:hypothetical protein BDQ12DRAFT_693277 [Crucibulum laeve]|uniref:F-box domain-containing protein n=1 Tax=Crucibulum laeve TaxID=68775 RepID=A0A5C3LH47_9AGAR|nr:hypothetical protein BDQ12DRAFT_693277 [Crucibulum laeve]
MAVQTVTAPVLTESVNLVRPLRPRLKSAATALLRITPSSHHTNDLREQNSRNPACRLPEEILCKIFMFIASDEPERQSNGCSWVNVSYVCSNWRRIALGCQDLWGFIDFSHPRWTSVTLRRAKLIPLSIKAAVNNRNIIDLRRTLQLAHRIEEIHLKSSAQDIRPLLETLAHPNPALKSLIIDVDVVAGTSGNVYDPLSFPTTGPPLSNLKYLELRGTPFYLLSTRCSSLTYLHLRDLPRSERPARDRFLSMLEKLPDLQYLTLDRTFPIMPLDSVVPDTARRITLPHLRAITLTGSVQEVADTLNCLLLPPSTRLICALERLHDLKENIWKLTQAIAVHSWAAAEVMPVETLVITGREEETRYMKNNEPNPDFRQSLRIRAYRPDAECGGAAFDLTVGPDPGITRDAVMITTLGAVWKALAITHVHTVALQNVDIVTQKSWTQFLRALPSLRVLDISGHAPSGLLWALLLNARSHADGDSDAQRLLVPRLTDVYLHGVDCSSGGFMVSQTRNINSHTDLDDSRFLDVFSTCFKERGQFNVKLRSLSITRCEYVLKRIIDDLRTRIAHVVWDSRGVAKERDMDASNPARYRDLWISGRPPVKHYFRLQTVMQF